MIHQFAENVSTEMMSSTRMKSVLATVAVVGWIIALLSVWLSKPWGAQLGVGYSPIRVLLMSVYAFFGPVLTAVYAMYLFTRNNEWLAPSGKYVPGTKYKVFTPTTLVTIAIVGALFAVAGFVGGLIGGDLQALVIASSVGLFGSVVGFCGLFIGQLVAAGLGGILGGAAAGITAVPFSATDASIWAVAGLLYYTFLRGKMRKLPFRLNLVGAYLLTILVWQLYFTIEFMVGLPWDAYVTTMAVYWTPGIGWIPTGIVMIFIAFLATDQINRLRLRAEE